MSGQSQEKFQLFERRPEEGSMKLSQVRLGLINFNLKCLAGPFRNESISLTTTPAGRVIGSQIEEPEEPAPK